MIAVVGLLMGIVGGLLLQPTCPRAAAVSADRRGRALDALFGGLRAMLDGIFDDRCS